MGKQPHGRRRQQRSTGKPKPANRTPAPNANQVGLRKRDDGAWELVHPRCARDRAEDLEEVRNMIEAGETDVARDECRWLLEGCTDCLEAHRLLGEIALAESDLPLARGHFGYAYRLGAEAIRRAGSSGPLPYRVPANQAFLESTKALAWCLMQLQKPDLAAEVVELALACDPSDPLAIAALRQGGASPPS